MIDTNGNLYLKYNYHNNLTHTLQNDYFDHQRINIYE